MGKYRIKDNQTGKTVVISGDAPPTEQEVEQIFSDAGLRSSTPEPSQGSTTRSWSDVPGAALSNAIPSFLQNISGFAGAVTSPLQTAKGLFNTVQGVANPFVSPTPEGLAFKEMVGERYGSVDALKNTMATDPFGFAMDASTVLGGVGAGVRGAALGASKLGAVKTASTLGKVGSGLKTAAAFTDPLSAPFNVAKKVIGSTAMPQHLWNAAVKYPKSVSLADRTKDFTTALDNRIVPSVKGMDKAKTIIRELNSSIEDTIVRGARAGQTVNAQDVVTRLNGLEKFFENTPFPTENLKKLQSMKDDFLASHGQNIPIEKAQQMKRNAYKLLDGMYGEMERVAVEAQKQIVRGVKEEIVNLHPELAGLNAKESALIQLTGAIENVVKRRTGADVFGYGGSIGLYGALSGQPALTGIAVVRDILQNPTVLAKISFALKSAAKRSKATSTVSGVTATTRHLEEE